MNLIFNGVGEHVYNFVQPHIKTSQHFEMKNQERSLPFKKN